MLIKTFLLNQFKMKHALVFVFSLLLSSAMLGQVSGVVTDAESGDPLIGATVLVKGASTGTITDIDGSYSIAANTGDVIEFSYTGYTSQDIAVTGNRLDVSLSSGVLVDEIVVTGYAVQRKRDITGAVSVVNSEELNQVSATSFTQKLEGRASGLQTSTSGQPGEGTVVRVRGISSFGNNDPLYVIDGVPVEDQFNTGFNPNDIESIQVLKDASASSIYGSRANNGVIIVTTKKGKAGKTTVNYSGYAGISTPVAKTDYLIKDPKDWSKYIHLAHDNAGLTIDPANPYADPNVLPEYSFPAGYSGDGSDYSYPDNIIMRANQNGTDWFDEIFGPALTHEHNIGVSGGSENSKYYVSASYLDQEGTLKNNFFERMGLRANSDFTKGKFTFGENLSLTRAQSVGNSGIGGGNQDEGGVIGQLSKINPLTPVFDVSGVNYGGDKAIGISNGSNPVALLDRAKDNVGTFYRILGNVYGQYAVTDQIKIKTSLGMNYFNNFTNGFNFPTFENREVSANNGFSEQWQNGFDWTWTNTATYNNTFSDVHNLQVLVGYEAIKQQGRTIGGGLSNYFTDDINAWYLQTGLAAPDSRTVFSFGGASSLASLFSKVDYTYDDKYLVSATVRRDGSSNFGPENRYGVFPAISLGWRVSNESFLQDHPVISDLKLRVGYGVTGNQRLNGSIFDNYNGGTGNTFYDIAGQQTGLTTGYALVSRGNSGLKWEENKSTNIGVDLALWDNKVNFVVDLYKRVTDGLIFNPALPGVAGSASPPFVNIGQMTNDGIDIGLDYNGRISKDFTWDAGIVFSAYRNTIDQIDDVGTTSFFSGGAPDRIGNLVINQVGNSISSFYGFTADGVFKSQAEVDAHADQVGAVVGGLRFADINGFNEDGTLSGTPDGVVNDADRGVIGSPHPDFTMGLNLGAKYKNFDFSAFLFGSQGHEIFNYQKAFEVFGLFNSNVRKDVLTRSWSPSNPDGDWPQPNINDIGSQVPSSFYVEDASYLRLKNLQVGYTFPSTTAGTFSNLRVYVQGQNLFTLSGYEGLDPAPSNFGGNADQLSGIDRGNYPANKTIMFGVNASF